MRIFHRFAFPGEGGGFLQWWDHCKRYSFSLKVVVEAVLKLSKRTAVLLCVDEILKAKQCIPEIQKLLGNGLSQLKSLYVFMTTLDSSINIAAERKRGSRNFRTISLGPLDPGQLPLTYPELTGAKSLIARQFIVACAGHARSLEHTSKAILEEGLSLSSNYF